MGMIVEAYPRARPKIIFGAGPTLHASAKFYTGLYWFEVKISVTIPMNSPHQSPTTTQPYAFH